MTITVAVRAGAGIASGSDLNVGYLAREDAESRAQGRAAGMAAFLKFVGESVDLSPEKPPKPSINAKSEPVKVDSAAIPGRNDGIDQRSRKALGNTAAQRAQTGPGLSPVCHEGRTGGAPLLNEPVNVAQAS
jgi:hypothetical protein